MRGKTAVQSPSWELQGAADEDSGTEELSAADCHAWAWPKSFQYIYQALLSFLSGMLVSRAVFFSGITEAA